MEPQMPFFAGEIFVSEVHKKPVLDQAGEEIGRLKDIIVVMGEPFPSVNALVVSVCRVVRQPTLMDDIIKKLDRSSSYSIPAPSTPLNVTAQTRRASKSSSLVPWS